MTMFVGYGLISQYFFICVVAGMSLVAIFKMLWKPFVPPVLLFYLFFHWLQIFCSVLFADFSQQSIDELFTSKGTEYLFVVTLLQLIAMTFILNGYVTPRNSKRQLVNIETLKLAAARLNIKNIIIGYFVMTMTMPVILFSEQVSASMFQLLLSFRIIKSLFVGLLVFILFLRKTSQKRLIIAVLVFDFVSSFISFFSDFKTLLIMIMIVYLTVNPYIRRRTILRMTPVAILLIVFFSLWSYLKGDYRSYLNEGSTAQAVNVSNTEALSYFFKSASTLGLNEIKQGAIKFLARVQYMERYSEVYKRVPAEIEHKEGEDMASALRFVLVPRFIDENKGVKDASIRTSYYTGKRFSKASQGTSISMGYFCDLYIDFGLYLMIIPLLILTAIIGIMYRRLINLKYNILFVYSLVVGTFLTFGTFESDLMLLLGVIRNNIAFLVVGYFTFFKFLHRFVLTKA